MGQKPIASSLYADGRMSVVITAETRKPLSVNDRIAAPADERAEAFSTVIAYAGRYTLPMTKLVHHVEASWMPINLARTWFAPSSWREIASPCEPRPCYRAACKQPPTSSGSA